MIPAKTLNTVEFDKILLELSKFAVLKRTKEEIISTVPASSYTEAEFLLKKTSEAFKYLYEYSVGGIYYFDDVESELKRVDAGASLNNAELLKVAGNLKSARLLKGDIEKFSDENLKIIPEIASRLFTNLEYEKEIYSKIISEDEISDNASVKLNSIRKSIKYLNVQIRDRLNSYMRGNFGKYLQESVVTMRSDRYVIPVKSEYRSFVKGFIHDQSSSGATVFIEPEQVMELNNELKKALLEEQNEIQRILYELSCKIAPMTQAIRYNAENIIDIDCAFAKAIYAFENKCSLPNLNNNGIVKINRGRHPLIDKKVVVPVDISLGKDYRFLLITGPNTGGKTVTLKLLGLFTIMSMSGLYIPADDDSDIAFFESIFSDVGDEQSIEQSLSTFSSHIKNIKNIIDNANEKSLVLIDEIGAGTDPEEGSALALSIIERLLELKCYGIITTHYSRLKEFAVECGQIENASMEFDPVSLKPLYKLNVGIPGSSNAIEIAKTLGIDLKIIDRALLNLTDDKISFEKVLKKAEQERRIAEQLKEELSLIKKEKQLELDNIAKEKDKISLERERIYNTAKQETKRIVADKLSEAEEIIEELKSILKRVGLESKELFRAGELRNRLKNSRYLTAENDAEPYELIKVEINKLKVGDSVYVKPLGTYAEVLGIKQNKNQVEVQIGSAKSTISINDIFNASRDKKREEKVKINKSGIKNLPLTEINVIGKTSLEAESLVNDFIYQAVMHNLEEVKIIHGVGEGVLLKKIRELLQNHKSVSSFRRGMYGEGENGVTIVTLK